MSIFLFSISALTVNKKSDKMTSIKQIKSSINFKGQFIMLNLTKEQAQDLNNQIKEKIIQERNSVFSLLQENEDFLNNNIGKDCGSYLLQMFPMSYNYQAYKDVVGLYQLFAQRIEQTVLEEVLDECYDLMLENLNNGIQMDEVLNLLDYSHVGEMIANHYHQKEEGEEE